jgi:hypothetical protein
MAKRKSVSIKVARARGIGHALTAKCRSQSPGLGMGSALIDAMYTANERALDFANNLDPNPAAKVARKPYADPRTYPVVDGPRDAAIRQVRAETNTVSRFAHFCRQADLDLKQAYEMNAESLRCRIVVKPREPDLCPRDQKAKDHAEAVAHAVAYTAERITDLELALAGARKRLTELSHPLTR